MLTVGDTFPSFKLQAVVSRDKGKEFSEISASQSESGLEALCPNPLTPSPCARASSYGGCRTKNATYTYTVWFYPGGTMFTSNAQVQTYCGAAYVPPT